MLRTMLSVTTRTIEYSFYALVILVPLVIAHDTFELFEFNKMWVTFGLTIVIVSCWIIKMILTQRVLLQRTPLDIPIVLFLLSQVIATIFSMDPHVSWWGYYSRFNGGLFSTISYILLYYAFVSNLLVHPHDQQPNDLSYGKKVTKRLVYVSLATGIAVALWGLPSHFGYDPTCLLFRGTLDVSCWTEAFQPKVRIFATLGQPNWLAAYLALLSPLLLAVIAIVFSSSFAAPQKSSPSWMRLLGRVGAILLTLLFFADLTYTDSQSGYAAFWAGIGLFGILFFLTRPFAVKRILTFLLLVVVPFLLFFFTVGAPGTRLDSLTLPGIQERLKATSQKQAPPPQKDSPAFPGELGGTDSLKIRAIVWNGAINTWKDNWLIGTGVETFAFAYYKYRPVEHNLTSEWDFLYNKAHNEYLNYLATTGILGLGSHLVMIFVFVIVVGSALLRNRKNLSHDALLLTGAMLASYLTIIITNFAGFSVVIVNIYFYLIPAWVFVLCNILRPAPYYTEALTTQNIPLSRWLMLSGVSFYAMYLILTLFQYWQADKAYALGYNRDRVNQYDLAYSDLRKAIDLRGNEPVFKDEFAVNNAVLAGAYAYQNDKENANRLAQQALTISNQIVAEHPNNVVFWKTRVRMLYILGQTDQRYLVQALQAIQKANALAPTDAKISYNLGLLYGQNNQKEKAVEVLEKTTQMKWDYQEAWYALGLYAHELALNNQGRVVRPEMQEKAVKAMKYILEKLNPNHKEAQEQLKSWGAL